SWVETLRKVYELFGKERVLLDGANAQHAAHQIAGEQPQLHKRIIAEINNQAQKARPRNTNSVYQFVDNASNTVIGRNTFNVEQEKVGGHYAVVGRNVPVVQSDDVDMVRVIFEASVADPIEVAALLFAGYLYAIRF